MVIIWAELDLQPKHWSKEIIKTFLNKDKQPNGNTSNEYHLFDRTSNRFQRISFVIKATCRITIDLECHFKFPTEIQSSYLLMFWIIIFFFSFFFKENIHWAHDCKLEKFAPQEIWHVDVSCKPLLHMLISLVSSYFTCGCPL